MNKPVWPAPGRNLKVLILGVLVLAGCGRSDRAQLTGTVALDGRPVEGAMLNFVPTSLETGAGSALTDQRGRYRAVTSRTIHWIMPGTYQVEIYGPAAWAAEQGLPAPENAVRISGRYRGPDTELLVEVGPGRNTHHFELGGAQ